MLAGLKRMISRGRRRGFRAKDYFLAAVGNPRLLTFAFGRVVTAKARNVESAVRASQRKELRAKTPMHPIPVDTLLSGLAEHMGVIVLDRTERSVSIGVAEVDLLSALVYITSATPGCIMSIDQEQVSFGSEFFKARALEARFISIAFNDPDMKPYTLCIEGYARQDFRKMGVAEHWQHHASRSLFRYS